MALLLEHQARRRAVHPVEHPAVAEVALVQAVAADAAAALQLPQFQPVQSRAVRMVNRI